MILIKAGGSAITDKRTPFSVKDGSLQTLAEELCGSKEDIVICHGGGSFGHPLALKYNIVGPITTTEQLNGVSKINIAMRKLSNIVSVALEKGGCRPFALQSSSLMKAEGGRISSFDADLVESIVNCGYIPILYGDVVYDIKNSFSIISGDQIMKKLAESFPGSRAIFLTDVDGIYSSDPKRDSKAKLVRELRFDDIGSVDAGTTGDVTGGMKGKLDEILQLKGMVEEIIITNLGKKGSLSSALRGENPGTRIRQ